MKGKTDIEEKFSFEYPSARTRAVGTILEKSGYPTWELAALNLELKGSEPELYDLLRFLAQHWRSQQRDG